MKLYKPLPKMLTIKKSKIHGLGLFALETIEPEVNLGMIHYISEFFDKECIRTPLGGFINHSNKPNCYKKEDDLIYEKRIYLITKNKIRKNEELTIKYTMYKVGNKNER